MDLRVGELSCIMDATETTLQSGTLPVTVCKCQFSYVSLLTVELKYNVANK